MMFIIQGTGFTSGATVNFVEEPQELTAGAYNPAVAATGTELFSRRLQELSETLRCIPGDVTGGDYRVGRIS